ncbi:Uncharacterised protein [Budvicia aquatica]|nr:Uncharacterised protein [Budvicia aquatica]
MMFVYAYLMMAVMFVIKHFIDSKQAAADNTPGSALSK